MIRAPKNASGSPVNAAGNGLPLLPLVLQQEAESDEDVERQQQRSPFARAQSQGINSLKSPLPFQLQRSATTPAIPVPGPRRSLTSSSLTVEKRRHAPTVLLTPPTPMESFNNAYISSESKKLRRLSTSNSFNSNLSVKQRVRVKAAIVGKLGQQMSDIHKAHGEEVGGDRSGRDRDGQYGRELELEPGRLAKWLTQDCCCGHCKPIGAISFGPFPSSLSFRLGPVLSPFSVVVSASTCLTKSLAQRAMASSGGGGTRCR